MSDIVRFGLVGYGLFGSHHARAIEGTSGAELAAVAVPSAKSRSLARAAHPGAEVLSDYRRLIERPDVDVVDVAAPNALHFEIAHAALDAGKHVFLEKPMALTVRECDALIAVARAKGLLLAVNHELRLSSLWSGVRRLIEDGAIGPPRHALVELSRFPYRQGSGGWRYDPARVGNWILEEPIHFFDLARWYLAPAGEPVSIYARANARRGSPAGLLDNFSAVVNFAGGEFAVVSQTLAAFEHHVTAKVAGDLGTIWAWWSAADARSDRPRFALRHGLGDNIHEVTFEKPTGELLELADHLGAMTRQVREGGGALPCTGEDGRWSALLCLAAQRSVETGSAVTVDEFLRDV